MFTCYIVDDDFAALEILQEYIATQPNLELVGYFDNPITASKAILEKEKVDVIFMDVEMPEMNGLELVNRIKDKFSKLVLTTGHLHYATDYIKMDADDFLLKPISVARFEKTLQKLFLARQRETFYEETIWLTPIVKRNKHSQVKINQIIAMEALDHKLIFYTTSETIVTNKSLSSMQWLLKNNDFIQCHRSFIIAKRFIRNIEGNIIVLENDIKVPLSRNRRESTIRNLTGIGTS